MTLPTLIIAAFVLLAAGSYALDHAAPPGLPRLHAWLQTHLFGSAKATSDLLSTIAGGLITVTSITISLLLLALQQSAGAMTSMVFDQFLRRRINQVYFGVFVGLALFALLTLASVSEDFNPVYGASLALLATVVALYLLILLLPPANAAVVVPVRARRHGYVTRVNLEAIETATRGAHGDVEIALLVSIGSFVAFEDLVAGVRSPTLDGTVSIAEIVRNAVRLELQRDIALDAAYGVEQIETIGWTSISTAQSNPTPGLLAIRSLRDVLARWSSEEDDASDAVSLPIVYRTTPSRAG